MRNTLIAIALAALSLGAAPPPTPVVVDGKALATSSLATIKNKEYVALRSLGYALGAQVAYDGKRKQATITTEFREAVLVIGSSVALVNGERRALDTPPLFVGGRVMLPLRATVVAMGAAVGYDRPTHSVVVSTRGVNSVPGAAPRNALPSANTLEGTVTDVQANMVPPAVAIVVDQLTYTITVPEGTKIQFRDTHGGSTGSGALSAVRPGDTLIATVDSGGHLIAIADIFSGFGGKIASASAENMVLTNGHVVEFDPSQTTVMLDGRSATFADLQAGDLVTVRADPRTGKVRDVVALTPGGTRASATATPSSGSPASTNGSSGGIEIAGVTDDADHAFRAGQTLHVTMDGTPGGTAVFDLSNVVVANHMTETRPGHYEGTYVVDVGTNLVDAPIIVRLQKNGVTAQAEGPDPLAIITSPPSIEDVKPESGSQVNNSRPNIYATFSTFGDRGMDAQSLKIIVNGKDVSAEATRTAAFISYLPASSFGGGTINVEVTGTDTAGNALDFKWSFSIVR
ncbi:MAG TPA: copper amine oxidase N-terminal domain-containing protein [Candidatus Eremiobacteraceae bacterium]|nr:copper amine oxidase N-terminal domain-containing protein [Candidatus Eremiobacteraceae bacterium]